MRRAWELAALALWLTGCSAPIRVWYGKSPDRAHEIAVLEASHRQYVVVDGVREEPFLAIGIEGLRWAGAGVVYPAATSRGWVVVGAGDPERAYDGIGEIALSSGGGSPSIAYAALRGEKWRVVADREEGPPFDAIAEGSLAVVKGRVLYVGMRGPSAFVVEGGKLSRPFRSVRSARFSGDGAHVIVVGGAEGGTELTLDGTPIADEKEIVDVVASPSADRLAFTARRGGGWFVVDGDRTFGPYERVSKLSLAGDKLGFAFGAAGIERVMGGGVAGPTWSNIGMESLQFSPSGAPSYRATRHDAHEGAYVVLAGHVYGPFAEVGPLAIAGEDAGVFVRPAGGRRFETRLSPAGAFPTRFEAAGDLVLGDGRFAFVGHEDGRTFVVSDRGEVTVDLVVEGTLVLGHTRAGSLLWACLAGESATKRLFILTERGVRIPFDSGELVALLAQRPANALGGDAEGALRAWIKAELARTDAPKAGVLDRRP